MTKQRALDITPTWFATLFGAIWRSAIRRQYELGALNSERALQGTLVGALATFAPELVTLVEPCVSDERVKPDLWIGRRGSSVALAVIELKYVLKKYPEWKKDLESLSSVIMNRRTASETDPATGASRNGFSCTRDTVGIYAVVGRGDAEAVGTNGLAKRASDAGLAVASDLRILHAWGNASTREFDVAWLMEGDSWRRGIRAVVTTRTHDEGDEDGD